MLNLACAVADFLWLHASHIEHRQEQVGHRGALLVLNVTTTLHLACGTARNECWQIHMFMTISIAQAASKHHEGNVQ